MTTATLTDELADYLADTPRQGEVRIYLDGAKPKTYANLIAPRWLGQHGLLRLEAPRSLYVDRADLDELYDGLVEASATATYSQQISLTAIASTVWALLGGERP